MNTGKPSKHGGDDDLRAVLSALREDCAPSRDLWPGIETRIAGAEQPPALLAGDKLPAAVLSALRYEARPARDLWPAIRARIDDRRRDHRWRRLRAPLTAAVALAASLLVVLGLQVYRQEAPAAGQTPLHASPEVLSAMADGPEDYALRRVSRHPLAPETRALVRANLKIVTSAEVQLRRALDTDPDSAYLESLLASARQQKQDLRYALAER